MQASQVDLSLSTTTSSDDEFQEEMGKIFDDEERIPPTIHGYVFNYMNASSDDEQA